MNKIFVLACLVCLACQKKTEYTDTQKIIFTNPSSQNVLYYFQATFGKDSLWLFGFGKDSFSYTEKKMVETSFWGTDRNRIFGAHLIFHHEIYNLDDTMSYILSIGEKMHLSHEDSTYIKYVNDNTFGEGYVNFIAEFRLFFDSNILKIMTKDDSMLEKFKDYYSTPH